MNDKQTPSLKKRGATVAAVLCFVAVIAIVGTYTWSGYSKKKQADKLAKTETEMTNDKEDSKETDGLVIDNRKTTVDSGDETKTTTDATDGVNTSEDGTQTQQTQTTEGTAASLNFTEDSTLLWPSNGSGSVLMNYSMDKTVYFETLDQYKYNPAMIITESVGDEVICSAAGLIKNIDVTAQTGTTVNVDLGNGYELIYGQLTEVPVNVGDYVDAGSVIGYVSQPTKYYSKEGSNLYFEMRKDGLPVNPEDYMDYADE